MFINSIKNESILNPQRHTGLPSCLPPNQSLKLTEPAVDDFARAKQIATIGQDVYKRQVLMQQVTIIRIA